RSLRVRPRAKRRRLRVRRAQSRAHSGQRARETRRRHARHHQRQSESPHRAMTVPGTTEPAIRLTDISKSFGAVQANRGASIEVRRGEIHALVGENGAGKSTLMRVMSGMYAPDRGRMDVDGRDV